MTAALSASIRAPSSIATSLGSQRATSSQTVADAAGRYGALCGLRASVNQSENLNSPPTTLSDTASHSVGSPSASPKISPWSELLAIAAHDVMAAK